MTDDLDRDLMRAFAAAAAPPSADDFTHQLQARVALRRRMQVVPRIVAIVALLCAGGLAAHALISASLIATERIGELLISPLGWVLSLLLAAVLMRRWRHLRQ